MNENYKTLLSYLQTASKYEASDLHFVANQSVKLRIKDSLRDVGPSLSSNKLREVLLSGMSEEQQQFLFKQKEIDFGLRVPEIGRFRVNVFTSQGNVEAVMRVIKEHVQGAADLNLPPVINKLAMLQEGLILVAGATGSGKSTTLSAMIDYVNVNANKRIITIEDPVEILHSNKKSVISQREVGEDTMSYQAALKSLLRQNPDIILIGEIRDKDTANSALQAAQTGHLVLSTIHAGSAEETVTRFSGLYNSEERPNVKRMLSYTLQGIIAQRLTVGVEGNKIPIMEIMTGSRRVRDSILADANDEPNREALSTIIRDEAINDMVTLDQFVMDLVIKGHIDAEQAVTEAVKPLWVRQQLQARGLL